MLISSQSGTYQYRLALSLDLLAVLVYDLPVATISIMLNASRFTVAPSVLFTEVDREAVLLNHQSGVYFSLDEVGTRIWRLIARGMPLREIHTALLAGYEVAPDAAWEDLVRLVGEMRSQGLVMEDAS
jgi:hypothetical protein